MAKPSATTNVVDVTRDTKTPSVLEDGRDQGPEWAPERRELAAMITIAVVSLMVALDATILVPVLPTLASDLQGTATDAFWAGTSYLLTSAVFQPFIAALSDIFGRKEMLMVAIFIFTLGTLLCAPIAHNFTVFLVGRSIQGIGGGGVITLGQVIYADIVPLRQRPKYFSIVLGTWAVGSVIGPLLGGAFVDRLSWRWCFYINFPLCALGFVLVPLFVRLTTEKTSLISKVRRVDWTGGFLFIGGLTCFLVGLSWAGVQFEWSSVQSIVPIVLGIVVVIISVFWECYRAKEPFLTVSLFSSPSAMAAFMCAFCNGFLLFCGLYYAPFYFTAVRFYTPTESGVTLLPVTCLLLPGSILVSILTSRLGRFRWAIWIGWAITTVGAGLLVLLDRDTPTAVWASILAVFGIGNGMVLTSVNVGIQAISRVEDCGRAGAMYAFMRSLGMAVGVAVGGTVFQNVMILRLRQLGLPEAIAHNAEAFVEQLRAMDPKDPVRIGALLAYVQGYHGVFYLMTGVAIFGLLASLVIRHHNMDKTLDSRYVLKGTAAHDNRKSYMSANSAPTLIAPPVGSSADSESFSRSNTIVGSARASSLLTKAVVAPTVEKDAATTVLTGPTVVNIILPEKDTTTVAINTSANEEGRHS